MVYDKRAWIICRLLVTMLHVRTFLGGGLQAPSLTSLSDFFFTRETRVRFVYACLTLARWLYKIDGERDEILVVDIYRCDEDDFRNKKIARDSGGWSDCEISYVLRHTRLLWRIWSNWN